MTPEQTKNFTDIRRILAALEESMQAEQSASDQIADLSALVYDAYFEAWRAGCDYGRCTVIDESDNSAMQSHWCNSSATRRRLGIVNSRLAEQSRRPWAGVSDNDRWNFICWLNQQTGKDFLNALPAAMLDSLWVTFYRVREGADPE